MSEETYFDKDVVSEKPSTGKIFLLQVVCIVVCLGGLGIATYCNLQGYYMAAVVSGLTGLFSMVGFIGTLRRC